MKLTVVFVEQVYQDLMDLPPHKVKEVLAEIARLAENDMASSYNIGKRYGFRSSIYAIDLPYCSIAYYLRGTKIIVLEIESFGLAIAGRFVHPAQRIEHYRTQTYGEIEKVRVLLNGTD